MPEQITISGEIMMWDESKFDWAKGGSYGSSYVTVNETAAVVQLQEEIVMLKDRLERTEAFTNSILKTLGDHVALQNSPPPLIIHKDDPRYDLSGLKIEKTLVDIPAKIISQTRTLKPKKVCDDEDYDRAMSLVGK